MSDYAVARELGVPRSNVWYWRRRAGRRARPAAAWCTAGSSYAYALGHYLGDGYITVPASGSAVLGVTVADEYPAVEAELRDALASVFPTARIRRHPRRKACAVLALSHPAVVSAFPQHGRGRKHERRIELVEWQRVLTHRFAEAFIRGLIHSDGSRCINRFRTKLAGGRVGEYQYVRYFFTNYSADIRRLFCEHADLLGIRWTQSNARNISVAHRDSVALLERFVGPKS